MGFSLRQHKELDFWDFLERKNCHLLVDKISEPVREILVLIGNVRRENVHTPAEVGSLVRAWVSTRLLKLAVVSEPGCRHAC